MLSVESTSQNVGHFPGKTGIDIVKGVRFSRQHD